MVPILSKRGDGGMKYVPAILAMGLLSVLLCGCGRAPGVSTPQAEAPSESTGAESGNFAARLEAAKGISSDLARISALADLARDAAQAGDGTVAKGAVEAMDSSELARDQTAAIAAELLAGVGRVDDAVAIAKLIGSELARDQVLARLAKGQ